MNKPTLVVVSGKPASGKTTLARKLSSEINLPFLSRDALKEGYLQSLRKSHHQIQDANKHVKETFFTTIHLLLKHQISLIVEVAFQDKLWRPKLSELQSIASIHIIVCEVEPELA